MSRLSTEAERQLEDLIDRFGLEAIYRATAEICEGRASHACESGENDADIEAMERAWSREARLVETLADRDHVS